MSSNRPVVECATDFSARASHAADAAARLAAGRSEPLLLVRVTGSRDREVLAWLKTRLQTEVERLVASGAAAESVLLEGDSPVDALLDVIRAERPDLIVVASKSGGPIDRWTPDSFSEQLAQSSPVSTLVLRHPGPFRDWSWTGRSLKILAALDLKAGSESVLRWVKELGRSGPLEVVPCHFNEIIPPTGEDLQPSYVQLQATNPPALQLQLERDVRRLVRDHLGSDVAQVIVKPLLGELYRALAQLDARDFGGSTVAADTGGAPAAARPVRIYNATMPRDDREPSVKWDGEWQVTIEVFRDLGLAFGAVLILIYMLMVGWFKTYTTPLIVMTVIPFSLVGILPAHAAMGAFFTATSMIGFMAGGGIVVRNSIILVDFIELRLSHGRSLRDACIESGAVRFRPMMLTALAVVVGGLVILADPIFQGLAISCCLARLPRSSLVRSRCR